jgi:IS605 OrfB family transposase
MSIQVKTLKVRIRDKHTDVLNRMAFDCNQVWNAANALSDEFSWVPVPEVGYINMQTSGFDLMKELKGIRKERDMLIGSSSFQEVVAIHAKSRKQFKTNKLKWRCSGGARRALGWVPFKSGAAQWINGQVRFCGIYFKCWDSYGLSQYDFRSGSFSQDARGRWYFNIVVQVACEETVAGKGQIGIDLGLKTTAVCSDGTVLERQNIYRNAEAKLATAQRAKKNKQVKNIHAKIKNRRADVLHKFSNKLVRENSLIAVGNVSASGLAKTKMAKSVLDAGWGILKTQLDYKSKRMRGVFIEVNERYSSQVCSCCGCIGDNSPKGRADLNKREWVCSHCGTFLDRDVNAALNILRMGHHTLAKGIFAL